MRFGVYHEGCKLRGIGMGRGGGGGGEDMVDNAQASREGGYRGSQLGGCMVGKRVFHSCQNQFAACGLQTVGGNTALALLLTVSSNLLGIFTMPFLLCRLLGATGSAVTVQPGPLLANLVKTILLPLLGGAFMRATIPG